MVRLAYHVFVQRDGLYGVAVSESGAMVRTALNFPTQARARAWAAQDSLIEAADIPFPDHAIAPHNAIPDDALGLMPRQKAPANGRP